MDQNNQATPTPTPSTPPPAGNATPAKSENIAMAIIAYILFFVPLLTGDAKKDEFVMFHVKQGLVVFIIGMAIWIVGMAIPWYWTPIHGLLTLCSLANLVLAILGIVNAANKKKEPLPIVGKYADYFKF